MTMGWIAKDLPTLVFMLLPGFIAAGVFYTLTAHPKSSEFERLIQSLIFTSIIKLLTILLKGFFSPSANGTPLAVGIPTRSLDGQLFSRFRSAFSSSG